ncbi:alpha-E domain-containing protein [Sutterella sp.]|uniref:alpha-E domain-containing protein n=1 Tax=Sutterella sp. TaxID=1981025 RepID=UPI0026DEE809|nr:alpha-E domain-containing protein [Sutterella sp.]MDO5531168.1 alpha-E domain-containing protein [Sutterella sp.]
MNHTHAISAEQADRLRWLGRYTERVGSTMRIVNRFLDVMIDGDGSAYTGFCDRLSIPHAIYKDAADFEQSYLYDAKNPDSIYSNLSRAYDNALVLRSFISSETLSFIQMSLNRLESLRGARSAFLETQQIIDWILAFWGSLEETVLDPQRRALILIGKYIERLDLELRLEIPVSEMRVTLQRLLIYMDRVGGLRKTKTRAALERLEDLFLKPDLSASERAEAIDLINEI